MTISADEIEAVAPDVPAMAQEGMGIKNPFITFESLLSLCQGNETLDFCLRDVVMKSLRYTETVCRFEQIARQQTRDADARAEIETLRGAVHDATISAINSLSRNMKKTGKDNSWISRIAVTRNPDSDRSRYGKFAMLIAFEICLQKGTHEHG